MTIWKTKYGWRAEFVHKGKRVMAKGHVPLQRRRKTVGKRRKGTPEEPAETFFPR